LKKKHSCCPLPRFANQCLSPFVFAEHSGTHSHLAFATLPLLIPFVAFLKPTASSRPSAPPRDSPKCLRFGHWLTLCTLNIHSFTYLLTYLLTHSLTHSLTHLLPCLLMSVPGIVSETSLRTFNFQNQNWSEPQGQHNSIGSDPFELTSPTQHASRRVISFWNFLA